MKAKVVGINEPNALSLAVYTLAKGGIVVAPSETVYAMIADATNMKTVDKVFACKGRSKTKALSVFVSDVFMLSDYTVLSDSAKKLANTYLPGAVTLIMKKRRPFKLAKNLTRTSTLAIRISSHPFIRKLIWNFFKPITATSANISGQKEISSGEEAVKVFGEKVDLIIDGGRIPKEPPSTIVDCTAKMCKILRKGKVKVKL